VALCLLGALLGASLWTARRVTALSDTLRAMAAQAKLYADEGEPDRALDELEAVVGYWHEAEGFTRVLLPQESLEEVEEALYGFSSDLLAGSARRMEASLARLEECLAQLAESERPCLESIF